MTTIDFLALLGKDHSSTYFRTFPAVRGSRDQRRVPRKGADMLGLDADQLTAENKSGSGVYYVVGSPTGASGVNSKTGKPTGCVIDGDIEHLPSLFIEWDGKDLDWQLNAWRELGLPEPTVIVFTGGASMHLYWVLDEPIDPETWRAVTGHLIKHAGSDPKICNPSRVMRLPGFRHVNKKTGEPGELVEVVHVSGKRYSLAEIEACLPEPEPEPQPERVVAGEWAAHAPAQVAASGATGDPLPPRPLEAIQAAVDCLPRREPGTNTYESYRRAICGCAAALAEIGQPEAMAAELFAGVFEGGQRQAEEILASSTTRNAPSFWAIAGEHGFDLRRHDLKGRRPQGQRRQQQAAPQPPPEPVPADACGMDVALQAVGDGWRRTKDANLVRTALPVGDLSRKLERLAGRLGFNELTSQLTVDGKPLAGPDVDYLHVRLNENGWKVSKQDAIDGLLRAAHRHSFHPVQAYLEEVAGTTQPLPMEQWERLDLHLLGIEDPIAARFLPQFLISAVARMFRPGCGVRRYPVFIGPQWRGKTALGRILFGAAHWVEGLQGGNDRDMRTRCHRGWGVELSELNGITKRADQESLKAFMTERVDVLRRPYARTEEALHRRFVFWGTSNGPPLRDMSGSTRFVCIPLPDKMLPLDWAAEHRDAIWARAVEQFQQIHPGEEPWDVTSEEERMQVAERNANHQEVDPWAESVEAFLRARAEANDLPVRVADLLHHLEVPVERQSNAAGARVRAISEALGWLWQQRWINRKAGIKAKGLWPPPAAPSGPHRAPTGPPPADPSAAQASGHMAPMAPTESKTFTGTVEVSRGGTGDAAIPGSFGASGGGHPPHPPNPSPPQGSEPRTGGGPVGASGGGHPPWLPEMARLAAERPTAAAFTLALELERHGHPGVTGRQVKLWLDRLRAADAKPGREAA
jgi:hypothetical protein